MTGLIDRSNPALYLSLVKKDQPPSSNNTQPTPLAPQPQGPTLEEQYGLQRGQVIFIVTHTAEYAGIKWTDGGISGAIYRVGRNEKTDEIFVTIYSSGFRTFNIKYAREAKRGKHHVPVGTVAVAEVEALHGTTIEKKGDITIECIGLPGKSCNQVRQIHASDRHLVKRCKDCQKTFSKLATKERMRAKRAAQQATKGPKNAKQLPQKEVGRPGNTSRKDGKNKKR